MLDSVPTEVQSTPEVLTQTELERQSADELRELLLKKWAKDRRIQRIDIEAAGVLTRRTGEADASYSIPGKGKRTNPAVEAIVSDDEEGAPIAPAKLWNRCQAAVLSAATVLKVSKRNLPVGDLTADLVAHALANGAKREAERGARRLSLATCKCGGPGRYRRAIIDDYGTVSGYSEQTYCTRHRPINRRSVVTPDLAPMPRADSCGADYLKRTAYGLLKGAVTRHAWTGAPMEDTPAPDPIGAALSPADICHVIGASRRERIALEHGLTDQSADELAVVYGGTASNVRSNVKRGTADLVARWDDVLSTLRAELDVVTDVGMSGEGYALSVAIRNELLAPAERRFSFTRNEWRALKLTKGAPYGRWLAHRQWRTIEESKYRDAYCPARWPMSTRVVALKRWPKRSKSSGRRIDNRRAMVPNYMHRPPRESQPPTVWGAMVLAASPRGVSVTMTNAWRTGMATYSPPKRNATARYPHGARIVKLDSIPRPEGVPFL